VCLDNFAKNEIVEMTVPGFINEIEHRKFGK